MNIPMELYRVFYVCANTLSFSRAAESLFVSQSSVSQSIKSLEKQLNTSLFTRTTKSVNLTIEGESLYQYVKSAFELISAAEVELQNLKNLESGTLRIGVSDTISKYYLIPRLQKFHERYPHIKIHIINRPSPQSISSLVNNHIDVAIVNLTEENLPSQLETHILASFKDVFIASGAFAYLKDHKTSLTSLSTLPLISLEQNSSTRLFFDQLFIRNGTPIIPEIEIGSVDLMIELVRIGLGIGFVPEYTLPTHGSVFPIRLNQDYPRRTISLIHKKTNYPQSIINKFLEGVQKGNFF